MEYGQKPSSSHGVFISIAPVISSAISVHVMNSFGHCGIKVYAAYFLVFAISATGFLYFMVEIASAKLCSKAVNVS